MSLYSLNNVSLSFNDVDVLKNINLRIEDVGLNIILGKSGSGKSSLLNVLYGILKSSKGGVLFAGKDINKFSDSEFSFFHSYECSIVFQHFNLFENFSSIDNVALPLLIRGEKKKEALKKAKELFSQFNLNYLESQMVSTLSGGEKQRISILRSLIISPKVILCDEPTGALDRVNSILVMEMFKKISNTICVILVSHDEELVVNYADRIIRLVDGKILSDTVINKTLNGNNTSVSKYSKNSKWTKQFIVEYLKENKFKNIFSIVSIVFSFVSIFLSFGFYNGSTLSQDNALKNNNSIFYATISNKSYYEVENSPLSFSKDARPSISEVDYISKDAPYLTFLPNLNYAFSSSPMANLASKSIDGFLLSPLLNDSRFSFLEEVIINEEMCKLLSLDKNNAIASRIKISNYSLFSLATSDKNNPLIKDEINYDIEFVVKEVVSEFSFLNSPKIYYSYNHLSSFLKSYNLINISKYKKEHINVYDYIVEANDDDALTSYSMNIFLNDINYADVFFDFIGRVNKNENNLKIESTVYDIKEAYINFMSSFSSALFIFTLIAYLGVNFIIAILSLSSFIQKKKEAAILTCLGAKNSSIISIYFKQNLILLSLSFLISLCCIFPMQLLLNKVIENSFHLTNLIDVPLQSFLGFPLLLPLALFLIALFVSSLFVLTPILFYRHVSICDELKEE